MFSILRYTVILEVLFIIWFAKMVFWLLERKSLVLPSVFISFFVVLLSVCVFENGVPQKKAQQKFLDIEPIILPKNTLLKLYGFPTALVVPEFSKHAHLRAVNYVPYNCDYQKGSDFVERGAFRKMRDEIEKDHKGPIAVVYVNFSLFQRTDVRKLHQKRLECEKRQKDGKSQKDLKCSLGLCETWNDFEDALIEELGDKYFCRPLKNNMDNRLHICVPKELKTQILGEEND